MFLLSTNKGAVMSDRDSNFQGTEKMKDKQDKNIPQGGDSDVARRHEDARKAEIIREFMKGLEQGF